MGRASILVVDDEPNILRTVRSALKVEGYDVEGIGDSVIALEKILTRAFDLVLMDVQMPKLTGLAVLEKVRAQGVDTPVVVMSGHGTIETAVQATRLGAQDFLEKPLSTEKLLLTIANILELSRLTTENKTLKRLSGSATGLLGESPVMRELRGRLRLAASANASVLVTGERGTGKELVARAIHDGSKRAQGPLEKLNCAAVPADLIESELFGHEAGAFTGASRMRRGKFERAHNGTLFLDEVGDMPSAMQAKLLRVLQEGELERVGGNEVQKVNVRIVAATNRDLPTEVKEGRFRPDLYDRLNVLPIHVPPLRQRREDVALLVAEFLPASCEVNDRALKKITPAAMGLLGKHEFQGNVRELKNIVERLVILTDDDLIDEQDVRAVLGTGVSPSGDGYYRPGVSLKEMLENAERDIVNRSLEHHKGNASQAARDLGLERSHFYKKMRSLGIKRVGSADGDGDLDSDD